MESDPWPGMGYRILELLQRDIVIDHTNNKNNILIRKRVMFETEKLIWNGKHLWNDSSKYAQNLMS